MYYLMQEIKNDSDLVLQTLVSGMHLSPEFGLSWRRIEEDGFLINEKVEMLLSSDSSVGITKSIGVAMIGLADALDRLKPDILVILGDRFEALAAATAALVARIPVAHIHGGEISEGAIDESIRHAITKLATYHFVSAESYRKRVIQLGERPESCWNFGAPGLDHLEKMTFLNKTQLEKTIGFMLGRKNFLVTYHPATAADENPVKAFGAILTALLKVKDATIFFTYPNSDTDGRIIIRMIDEFVEKNPGKAFASANLGQLRYLSLLKISHAVIGNSSSGIIEAPALKVPTINIGDRQKGRLRSLSIVDVKPTSAAILSAIKMLDSADFKATLAESKSCYGIGNASQKIKNVLKTVAVGSFISKRFYDLPVCKDKNNDL